MSKLLLILNETTTKQINLHVNEMTVGRDRNNDIVLDSAQVSRFHAVLISHHVFTTVEDLGSHNGTCVNGVKVKSQVLIHGDELSIGPYKMRFLATDQIFTKIEAMRLATIPGMLADLDLLKRPVVPKPRSDKTGA